MEKEKKNKKRSRKECGGCRSTQTFAKQRLVFSPSVRNLMLNREGRCTTRLDRIGHRGTEGQAVFFFLPITGYGYTESKDGGYRGRRGTTARHRPGPQQGSRLGPVPCIKRVQPDTVPSDLLYLHYWSSPSCGAVVMVDVISSSLGVLPLLPSRGQARGGQGISSRRRRLTQCGEKAKQRQPISTG